MLINKKKYFSTKLLLLYIILYQQFNSGQADRKLPDSEKNVYKIILCTNTFHHANDEDFEAVSKVLANHFIRTSQLDGEIEVVVAKTREDILFHTSIKYDMIVISTQDYIDLKSSRPLEPALINFTNGSIGQKFLLVTHRLDNITSIKQLQNKTILIESRTEQNSPRFWLDKILRTNKLSIKEKFFDEIKFENKVTNTLLPVFFRKVHAAIVTESGFNLVAELNPQIKKELTIVAESKYIADGIICVNSSEKNLERKKSVIDIMSNVHNNTYGSQILTFFATDKVIKFKPEFLNEYLELFK